MAENPYAPPELRDSADIQSTAVRPRRPGGVIVVALLFAIPGTVVGLAMLGYYLTERQEFRRMVETRPAVILIMLSTFLLGIASAIGMWLRSRMGWHIGHLYSLVWLYGAARGWWVHGVSPDVALWVFVGVHTIAIVYLHFTTPRAYFGLTKTTALIAAVALGVAAAAFYHTLTWIPVLLGWVRAQ